MDGDRAILTMKEAADLLRVGQSTLYRLVDQGIIPAVKVPTTCVLRIRRAALDRLLEEWESRGRRGRRRMVVQPGGRAELR